jgi:hypothetical protein
MLESILQLLRNTNVQSLGALCHAFLEVTDESGAGDEDFGHGGRGWNYCSVVNEWPQMNTDKHG